eukprot:6340462-Prymnesium_polylepis.1
MSRAIRGRWRMCTRACARRCTSHCGESSTPGSLARVRAALEFENTYRRRCLNPLRRLQKINFDVRLCAVTEVVNPKLKTDRVRYPSHVCQ